MVIHISHRNTVGNLETPKASIRLWKPLPARAVKIIVISKLTWIWLLFWHPVRWRGVCLMLIQVSYDLLLADSDYSVSCHKQAEIVKGKKPVCDYVYIIIYSHMTMTSWDFPSHVVLCGFGITHTEQPLSKWIYISLGCLSENACVFCISREQVQQKKFWFGCKSLKDWSDKKIQYNNND